MEKGIIKFDHKPTDEELQEYMIPDKQIILRHIIESSWEVDYL